MLTWTFWGECARGTSSALEPTARPASRWQDVPRVQPEDGHFWEVGASPLGKTTQGERPLHPFFPTWEADTVGRGGEKTTRITVSLTRSPSTTQLLHRPRGQSPAAWVSVGHCPWLFSRQQRCPDLGKGLREACTSAPSTCPTHPVGIWGSICAGPGSELWAPVCSGGGTGHAGCPDCSPLVRWGRDLTSFLKLFSWAPHGDILIQ